jgi:hypothetical protein
MGLPMMTKPEGAVGLEEARTAHGPWYVVFVDYPEIGTLEKRKVCPGRVWFDPDDRFGFCFLNYFHALAYSLKVKKDASSQQRG